MEAPKSAESKAREEWKAEEKKAVKGNERDMPKKEKEMCMKKCRLVVQ